MDILESSFSININKNGTNEYIKSFIAKTSFHSLSIETLKSAIQKRINNTPCVIPTIFTAIGISKKYLSGIAIKRSIKYDNPSMIEIALNCLNVDVSIIAPSFIDCNYRDYYLHRANINIKNTKLRLLLSL